MDQVQIKITAQQVITARYGTLSNGDVLRTDAAFARHLVEDCAAAKYLLSSTTPLKPQIFPAKPSAAPKRRPQHDHQIS